MAWPKRVPKRSRGRLADERGVALALSLLVVAALSITTAALAELIASNEHAFGRDRQERLAFNTAEAGLNYGISYLAQTADPNGTTAINTSIGSSGTPIPFGTTAPAGTGKGGWWATKTAAHQWTIWANGTSPNGQVVRHLAVQVVSKTEVGTVTPASLAWGFGLFVANPGPSCFTPQGTTNLTISLYVNGCIKLSGSAGIAEPSGSTSPSVEVYAATSISIQGNSASIGASGSPVLSVIAPGGCTGAKGVICSNTPSSKVWAAGYTGASQNLSKPALYPDSVYGLADWKNGPLCTGAGYPVFDNDTTRNLSAPSPNLFPGTSYDCTIYPTAAHTGTPVGTLSWDATNGLLTATGTVFFDSDLSLSNGAVAYTNGTFATLYFDGAVTINGNSALCGPPASPSGSSCSGKWDATKGAIVMAAINATGASPAWKVNGSAEYDVAAYVVGNYTNNGNGNVTGPVITDTASVAGNGSSTDVSSPPPSAPGASYTTPGATDWGVIPGTWQQLTS